MEKNRDVNTKRRMKIVAGLGSIEDYIPFVQAGADEFFCGYVPLDWSKKYGVISPLNRREVVNYNVQIGSMEDLLILHKMVEKYKRPVQLTFNSLTYLPEQYDLIANTISTCINIGFDQFIIADPALILYLEQHGIKAKIHLSGETSEINRSTLDFFHDFGLSRLIFHRKNSIANMRSCIAHEKKQGSKMEYEAFVLNEYCHFSGAFCNSLHCDELSHLCLVPYEIGPIHADMTVEDPMLEKDERIRSEEYVTGSTGCGLCALYDLYEVGITHLKLVGRGNYADHMRHDIQQLSLALDILEEENKKEIYISRMKQELFQKTCSGNCYYRHLNETQL